MFLALGIADNVEVFSGRHFTSSEGSIDDQ
jgi:hypothetical protein